MDESSQGRHYQAPDHVVATQKALETSLFRDGSYAEIVDKHRKPASTRHAVRSLKHESTRVLSNGQDLGNHNTLFPTSPNRSAVQRSNSLAGLILKAVAGGLDRKNRDAMPKEAKIKKLQDLSVSLHGGNSFLEVSGTTRNEQLTSKSSPRHTKKEDPLRDNESDSDCNGHDKRETRQRSRRTAPHKAHSTDAGIRRKDVVDGRRGHHSKSAPRGASSLSPVKVNCSIKSDIISIKSNIISHGINNETSSRHTAPHKRQTSDGRTHHKTNVTEVRRHHSKNSPRRANSLSPVNMRQVLNADGFEKKMREATSRKHNSKDENKSTRGRGHTEHHDDDNEGGIPRSGSDPFMVTSQNPRPRSPRRATFQIRACGKGVEDNKDQDYEMPRKCISAASKSNTKSHRPTGGTGRGRSPKALSSDGVTKPRTSHGSKNVSGDQLDQFAKKHSSSEGKDEEPPKTTLRRQRLNSNGMEIQVEVPRRRISGQISSGAVSRRNGVRDYRRAASCSPMPTKPSGDGFRGIREHSFGRLPVKDDEEEVEKEKSAQGKCSKTRLAEGEALSTPTHIGRVSAVATNKTKLSSLHTTGGRLTASSLKERLKKAIDEDVTDEAPAEPVIDESESHRSHSSRSGTADYSKHKKCTLGIVVPFTKEIPSEYKKKVKEARKRTNPGPDHEAFDDLYDDDEL
jgi:hypothetical protein